MRLFFIVSLCLFFFGCKSNKNEFTEQEKVNTEIKFDSVINNNIEKIQAEKNINIDSAQLIKIYSKIGKWNIHGNEPFWNLQIINEKVLFTKLNENIDTVYLRIADFLFIDGGISCELIDKNQNKAHLSIHKKANKISDGMSDILYDFAAKFNYENKELNGVAEKK